MLSRIPRTPRSTASHRLRRDLLSFLPRLCLVAALVLATAVPAIGQGWSKLLLSPQQLWATTMAEAPSGGWWLAGVVSGPSDGQNLWVGRLDGRADLLWQRSYFTLQGLSEGAFGVLPTDDGGVLLTGLFGGGGTLALRLADDGSLQWAKLYEARVDGAAVALGRDGYLLLGTSTLLRIDGSGQPAWVRRYDTEPPGRFEDLAFDPATDTVLVVGVVEENEVSGGMPADLWAMAVDPDDGSVLWNRTYGRQDNDERGRGVVSLGGGAWAVAAHVWDLGGGWVLRLGPGGAVDWERVLDLDAAVSLRSVAALPGGGIAAVAKTHLQTDERVWVVRFDAAGDIAEESLHPIPAGAGGSGHPADVAARSGGGVHVVSDTTNGIWLLGLDPGLRQPSGCAEVTPTGDEPWPLGPEVGSLEVTVTEASDGWFVPQVATDVVSMEAEAVCAGCYEPLVCATCSGVDPLWARTFGHPGVDGRLAPTPLPDGALVHGWTHWSDATLDDLWLLRVDEAGGLVSSSALGTVGASERPAALALTADGGWALLAESGDPTWVEGPRETALWLLRFAGDGSLLWDRAWDAPGVDSGADLVALPDGGFVIAARTESGRAAGTDGWLIRTDPAGHTVWQSSYGADGTDSPTALLPLADGRFLVAGTSDSFGAGDMDGWIFTVDAAGQLVGSVVYSVGREPDLLRDLVASPDGSALYAVGDTWSTDRYGDLWLLRLDPTGGLAGSWVADGGASDTGLSLVPSLHPQGGVVVAGETISFGHGKNDHWLLDLAADGTLRWGRTYGAGWVESGGAVARSDDCGLWLGGATESFGDEGWLLRLAEQGELDCRVVDRAEPEVRERPVERDEAPLVWGPLDVPERDPRILGDGTNPRLERLCGD